jgi:hypothetical protein
MWGWGGRAKKPVRKIKGNDLKLNQPQAKELLELHKNRACFKNYERAGYFHLNCDIRSVFNFGRQ